MPRSPIPVLCQIANNLRGKREYAHPFNKENCMQTKNLNIKGGKHSDYNIWDSIFTDNLRVSEAFLSKEKHQTL